MRPHTGKALSNHNSFSPSQSHETVPLKSGEKIYKYFPPDVLQEVVVLVEARLQLLNLTVTQGDSWAQTRTCCIT
jgi:hypothetical protein